MRAAGVVGAVEMALYRRFACRRYDQKVNKRRLRQFVFRRSDGQAFIKAIVGSIQIQALSPIMSLTSVSTDGVSFFFSPDPFDPFGVEANAATRE
jgi:hypothetical protein